jgi:hypothetical protein
MIASDSDILLLLGLGGASASVPRWRDSNLSRFAGVSEAKAEWESAGEILRGAKDLEPMAERSKSLARPERFELPT